MNYFQTTSGRVLTGSCYNLEKAGLKVEDFDMLATMVVWI